MIFACAIDPVRWRAQRRRPNSCNWCYCLSVAVIFKISKTKFPFNCEKVFFPNWDQSRFHHQFFYFQYYFILSWSRVPHPKLRAYKSIWWLIDARNFGYDVSARRPARPAIHTLIKEKRRLCRGGTGSPRHESLCKPWRNVSHFKGKHGIFMSYLFVLWLLNNPFLKFRYQWMCFQSMC